MFTQLEDNLKDVWERGDLTSRDIIQIGIELIESAENLHSTGYIHTDIKLDNMMVNSNN